MISKGIAPEPFWRYTRPVSVSAHLSPEPERRLWIIHESLRQAVDGYDSRIAALAALCAVEAALLRSPSMACLAGLGFAALTPVSRLPKTLAYLEEGRRKPRADDNLLLPEDLTKYSHGELIFRLDKYLGGGITATPYYEDLVGRILEHAHQASRKKRLLAAMCALAALGQLGLAYMALR